MLVSSETKTDSQISDFITAQCWVQSLSGCKTNSQVTVFKFVYQTRRKTFQMEMDIGIACQKGQKQNT